MNDYPSVICSYCRYTDFGTAAVGTGPHNLCEGMGCTSAYESWQEANPDDKSELEELF